MKEPLNHDSILPWEKDLIVEKLPTSVSDFCKLSIVIPIYNSGDFLEKTIRSLLCNDLHNVEIIVSDGGSTDNTMSILEYYREFFDLIISEKDSGQSDAINKGFQKANGDLLYWLNGDDVVLPNALSKVRKFYIENNNPDFIVGNAHMTEKDFSSINHFIFSQQKIEFDYLIDYASNHLVQPSVFFTMSAWNHCGPLDVNDHFAMDADLFLSIAKNFTGVHLDEDLAYSVYHEDCKTRGKRAESITQLAIVQAKHGGIKYAKKTLDILVSLFNEAVSKQRASVQTNFNDFQDELLALIHHIEDN